MCSSCLIFLPSSSPFSAQHLTSLFNDLEIINGFSSPHNHGTNASMVASAPEGTQTKTKHNNPLIRHGNNRRELLDFLEWFYKYSKIREFAFKNKGNVWVVSIVFEAYKTDMRKEREGRKSI